MRELPHYSMEANHFFAHQFLLLTVHNILARKLSQLVERLFDFVVAPCLSAIGLPVSLWTATRVVGFGFPIVYGRMRIGQQKDRSHVANFARRL